MFSGGNYRVYLLGNPVSYIPTEMGKDGFTESSTVVDRMTKVVDL